MRERTFSFILKVHVLLPDRPLEGEALLRGSVQQVGQDETRYFGSWEGLLDILQDRVAAAGSDRGTVTPAEQPTPDDEAAGGRPPGA